LAEQRTPLFTTDLLIGSSGIPLFVQYEKLLSLLPNLYSVGEPE
jgi:hypothetical protein